MNNFDISRITFGALPSKTDVRDYEYVPCATATEFPKEFELPMVRVKNQGSVGSCVAHSLSEVVEYFNSIQTKDTSEMSVGFIYGDRRNDSRDAQGPGMYVRSALDNLRNYGDVKSIYFPENVEVPKAITLFEGRVKDLEGVAKPFRITSYYRLYTQDAIKSSLMNNGPVVFAIDWYNELHLDTDGYTMTGERKTPSGGHCMVICGWNEKGWKVLNSWGTSYGKGGYFIYPFDYPISEAWGVIDENTENSSEIIKPYSGFFGKIIAFFLNIILNLKGRK